MSFVRFGSPLLKITVNRKQKTNDNLRKFCLLFCENRISREEETKGLAMFKLHGYPWYPQAEETVYSRMMLSQVLANLRALGYKLYTSVDISGGSDGEDAETWIFRRVGNAWS